MSLKNPLFEELDFRPSPIGTLSLRRRRRSAEGEDIYEIKLDEGYLMSSLFTQGEIALARLALRSLEDRPLDVVVGGLGLGYTAKAALDHPGVASLIVVEAIPEVIEWHRRHLLPLGEELAHDPRCRLVCGNFFAMAARGGALDPEAPARRHDAILVDIDNSPRSLLHADNAAFYEVEGLKALADKLVDGGVFGLWSTDRPDEEYVARVESVFETVESHVVEFENPYRGSLAINTIYVAHKAATQEDPG